MSKISTLTKSATSVAAISLSSPIFINAFLGIRSRIIRVTSEPRFLKIFANSIAMIPDPVIATLLGKCDRVLIESLSNTRFPSNGMPPGRNGADPVASRIFSACTVEQILSSAVTNKDDEPPESEKAA